MQHLTFPSVNYLDVVCAVISNPAGKVLICQRPAEAQQAGMWEFPGGKVESGEALEEALQREIAEELDCKIEVQQQLPTVVHPYPDFTIRLMPFACALLEGEQPKALEHAAIEWSEIAQIDLQKMSAADREIVNNLRISLRIE